MIQYEENGYLITEYDSGSIEKVLIQEVIEVTREEYLITQKKEKIKQLSQECQDRIINGIDFTWDGETHHYSLDIPDQMEINVLYNNIKQGATKTSWHYNGGTCEEWSSEKFTAFAEQALTFVTYTKVRFNTGIRPLIESLDDSNQINDITLDTTLSEETNLLIDYLVSVTLTGQ